MTKQQSVTGDAGAEPCASDISAFVPQTSESVYSDTVRELLNHTLNASWPDLNAPVCSGPILAWIGRSLLILTAVSLLTMPVTQHLWTWDHFLHGGQDFELSTLFVLSFLCLVLVLSKHGKQCIDSLFANWSLPAFIFNHRRLVRSPMRGAFVIRLAERVPSPDLAIYNLPLQI
jgi:hypothetical protein